MGMYINKGNNDFRDIVAHEYVDKSSLILREMGTDEFITTSYVDLLRRLFKGSGSNTVFAGAYLTGILPIKKYNTESALNNFCEYSMIAPAFLAPWYVILRDYATGKGYADLVMIPRRNVSKPALVIELKFNHSADTAIDKIKRKDYPEKIADYTGDILLVGINYDKETKQHTCKIETYHP